MHILNSLLPIFAVIGLGILLRWNQFLTAEATRGFNRFAYFFALPVYLFYKLGNASAGTGLANRFFGTMLITAALTLLAAWLVTHFLKYQNGTRGATIQASFRGNLAFIGIPLMLFSIYELPIDRQQQIETAMLIAMVPIVLFYNIIAVAVLAIYNDNLAAAFSWQSMVKNIVLNPLIAGCVAGALAHLVGWQIPTAINRTCEVIGQSAFPLALLGIGSQLAAVSVKGQWSHALLISGIKCVLCPLIGLAVATQFGLVGVELQVVLIMCAVPTAVSSFVLADQMSADPDLAAGSVVICTAFSLPTLWILLALTGSG